MVNWAVAMPDHQRIGCRNRARDIVFGRRDGCAWGQALGKLCRKRGRQRTSGAVGVFGVGAPAAQATFAVIFMATSFVMQ